VKSKTCNTCKTEKLISEFTVRKSGARSGQPVSQCKECLQGKQKIRKDRDPTIYRRVEWPSKLKRVYGITVDDYYKMLANQNGGCAICGSKVASARRRKYVATEMFFVDHCHSTGKVRGLLCGTCNRGLGYFKDSPELLSNAIAYLKE
jgi:hypothetical protein